jgi:hypothetical protein
VPLPECRTLMASFGSPQPLPLCWNGLRTSLRTDVPASTSWAYYFSSLGDLMLSIHLMNHSEKTKSLMWTNCQPRLSNVSAVILQLALHDTIRRNSVIFDLYKMAIASKISLRCRECAGSIRRQQLYSFFVKTTTNRQVEDCYPTAQMMVIRYTRRPQMEYLSTPRVFLQFLKLI